MRFISIKSISWLTCRHFTSSQTLRGPLDCPSVIKTTSMQLDGNSPHFCMLISSLHAHLAALPEWVDPPWYTVFAIACLVAFRPARVLSKQSKQNSNHLLELNVISANCTGAQKKKEWECLRHYSFSERSVVQYSPRCQGQRERSALRCYPHRNPLVDVDETDDWGSISLLLIFYLYTHAQKNKTGKLHTDTAPKDTYHNLILAFK